MRHRKGGRPRLWTDEMILQAIRYLARELGHTPSARELARSEHAPSECLIRQRFGSISMAMRRAGLTPNPRGGAWRSDRVEPERSNHKWVLPTIDPEKARAITDAKRAHWGFAVSRSAAPASTATPDVSSRRTA